MLNRSIISERSINRRWRAEYLPPFRQNHCLPDARVRALNNSAVLKADVHTKCIYWNKRANVFSGRQSVSIGKNTVFEDRRSRSSPHQIIVNRVFVCGRSLIQAARPWICRRILCLLWCFWLENLSPATHSFGFLLLDESWSISLQASSILPSDFVSTTFESR